jgi:isoamylase
VPMLLAGDEIGRTQLGNNNAYCQDNELSWIDWEHIRREDERLRDFVRFLVNLRRRHRVFSRPRFFRGEVVSEAGLKDITWLMPEGHETKIEDWRNPTPQSIAYVLGGAAGEFYTPGGQRDIDESFLVMLNAWHEGLEYRIPTLPVTMAWELLVDTATETGFGRDGRLFSAGEVFSLKPRSFALFINRAPERPTHAPTGVIGVVPLPTPLPAETMPPTAEQGPSGDEDETPP